MDIKQEILNQTISLNKVLENCFELLTVGAQNSQSPFHTPIIATVNNYKPSARTVVLRRFDREFLRLIFHTDRRSNKIADLKENNNLSWVFYDPSQSIQLRIESTAVVLLNDDLFEEQWKNSQIMSRRCYLIKDNPGTITTMPSSGIPDKLISRRPTIEESEEGKKNFAVIAAKINSINWLYLKSDGNIGAEFYFEKSGINQNWIIP